MYEYRCVVAAVVDADTIDAVVDLGFHVAVSTRLRLDGIDAPERYTEEGKTATAYLVSLLSAPSGGGWLPLTARTRKDRTEKFGRMLAVLILPDGTDVNAEMVRAGHARPYDGGRR